MAPDSRRTEANAASPADGIAELSTKERQVLQDAVALASRLVRESDPPGRRDAHPKHHGLVHAELRLRSDIPADLQHGLFRPPPPGETAGPYKAYVRFSNAQPGSDNQRHVHGMAIKLLGVGGVKLVDDEADTFDLLLVDHPVFFAADPATYVDFMHLVAGPPRGTGVIGRLWFAIRTAAWLTFRHPVEMWLLSRTGSRIASPLATSYFSMTPFALGPHAVKYIARPVGPRPQQVPGGAADDYLRRALARELEAEECWFDLFVQLRSDPEAMPIDDPRVEWGVPDSRPVPVATLRIYRQRFESREQMDLAESISFNPWRVTAAHRPLCSLNRLRREVYLEIARLRHQLSGVANPPRRTYDWARFAGAIIDPGNRVDDPAA